MKHYAPYTDTYSYSNFSYPSYLKRREKTRKARSSYFLEINANLISLHLSFSILPNENEKKNKAPKTGSSHYASPSSTLLLLPTFDHTSIHMEAPAAFSFATNRRPKSASHWLRYPIQMRLTSCVVRASSNRSFAMRETNLS